MPISIREVECCLLCASARLESTCSTFASIATDVSLPPLSAIRSAGPKVASLAASHLHISSAASLWLIMEATVSSIPLFAGVLKSCSGNTAVNYLPRVTYTKRKRSRSGSHESLLHTEMDSWALDPRNSTLEPGQIAQYKIAGQPFNEDLPGPNFPHEAQKPAIYASANVSENDLAAIEGSTPAARNHIGMRRQHLAALTTVLHRCMLEGDYVRAGRAWGTLLRVDLEGHSMDLRTDGSWGIGAEILMFRASQLARNQVQELNNQREDSSEESDSIERPAEYNTVSFFSRDGFLKAKDYYERLILQYPYRKAAPHTVSSLDFYPAMFGLWIYSIQEQSKTTYNAAREDDRGELQQEEDAEIHARIQRQALEQAAEISARLDELLVSPPYSDHPKLWRLRGMVAVWEADLIRLLASPAPECAALFADADYIGSSSHLHLERLMAVKSKARQAFETVARLDKDSDLGIPNIDVL